MISIFLRAKKESMSAPTSTEWLPNSRDHFTRTATTVINGYLQGACSQTTSHLFWFGSKIIIIMYDNLTIIMDIKLIVNNNYLVLILYYISYRKCSYEILVIRRRLIRIYLKSLGILKSLYYCDSAFAIRPRKTHDEKSSNMADKNIAILFVRCSTTHTVTNLINKKFTERSKRYEGRRLNWNRKLLALTVFWRCLVYRTRGRRRFVSVKYKNNVFLLILNIF